MLKTKVLIFEDESIIAADLSKKLISLGYEVTGIFSNAEQGLANIPQNIPDVILMDIVLKGEMDGIEAAKIIRNQFNITVIFITAHTDKETFNRAKIVQPFGYIVKPVNNRELETTIEIALYKHKMESKLIESELKYRTLVLTATDAVLIINKDGLITSYNYKALELFGLNEEEISNLPITRIIDYPFITDFTRQQIAKKELKSNSSNLLELEVIKKGGEKFPVEFSFSAWEVFNEQFFTIILRDISARRKTENELKKSRLELEKRVEERTIELKSLIDQATLPMRFADAQGNITYRNKAWKSIFKDSSDSQENLFKDPIVARFGYNEQLHDLFLRGGSFMTKPIFIDPEDFNLFYIREGQLFIYHFYAVVDEEGNPHRVVNFLENITEQSKVEEISKELKEQKIKSINIAENIEKERKRISQEIHDGLGQLLHAIKLNIELYEKSCVIQDKYLLKAKNLLSSASEEIKKVVMALYPSSLDRYGFISAVKVLINDFTLTSGIKIEFNSNLNEYPLDSKYVHALFRIIQEGLHNISKHSGASFAEINVFINNGLIHATMKDNGTGINIQEAEIKKNKFGITNMKERIEILGGWFTIEKSPEGGTEIEIEIPLEEYENGC